MAGINDEHARNNSRKDSLPYVYLTLRGIATTDFKLKTLPHVDAALEMRNAAWQCATITHELAGDGLYGLIEHVENGQVHQDQLADTLELGFERDHQFTRLRCLRRLGPHAMANIFIQGL